MAIDMSYFGPQDKSTIDEEVTPEDTPDPEGYRVCGDYLLVRPVKTRMDKVGSILIADSTKDDVKYLHNVGRILDFGPRCYKTRDDKVIEWVKGGLKVGDIIQWERFVGKRIRYKGVNLVLLKDTAVQGVVDSQFDIDPMVAIESA